MYNKGDLIVITNGGGSPQMNLQEEDNIFLFVSKGDLGVVLGTVSPNESIPIWFFNLKDKLYLSPACLKKVSK